MDRLRPQLFACRAVWSIHLPSLHPALPQPPKLPIRLSESPTLRALLDQSVEEGLQIEFRVQRVLVD